VDHDSFDRVARLLGAAGTRRGALGALLSAAVLGTADVAAAKRQRKRGKNRVATQALSGCANPGPGQDLSRCSFLGQDLRGINLRGANLSRADFTGADLCGADLRAANLQRTDFMGANLTRVDLRGTSLSTANLAGAIFCQTRRPNGTRDSSTCPPDGEVCCDDAECPAGATCHRGSCLAGGCVTVTQICSPDATCCSGAVCTEVATDFELCVLNCTSDGDCPNTNLECRANDFVCPGLGRKCCQRKDCSIGGDCPSGRCCLTTCCQANEVCQPGHGCLQIE
jgi:hypothetical protein